MWYYDPFIVVPAVFTGIALLLTIPTTLFFRKDHMMTAGFFGSLALVCVIISTVAGMFGWILNNEEVFNKWMAIIFS